MGEANEKDTILDFTNCGLACLNKIELYMWEKRGCMNANPGFDVEGICDHCPFFFEPTYPDSNSVCLLDCTEEALKTFKREEKA